MRPSSAYLFEIWKFVFVGCRHGDDFDAGIKVLGDAAEVTAILVETDELRNLVVGVNDVDGETSVVVEGISCSILGGSQIVES